MKPMKLGLWALDSGVRYTRIISSVSSSASADAMSHKQKMGSHWRKRGKTFHLATAYNLQSDTWWFAL